LWAKVSNKAALIDLANAGKEDEGRKRIVFLRWVIASQAGAPAGERRRNSDSASTSGASVEMPAVLSSWGCDKRLWAKVSNKEPLIDLANAGKEEEGRKRIAFLRWVIADQAGASGQPAKWATAKAKR
jgi:hypothetical protein